MGCDIHGFVEVRDTSYQRSTWDAIITDGLTDRWYGLFSRFFGVRSYGQKHLWGGRGFPKDADWTTKEAYYEHDEDNEPKEDEPNPDWHSASWVLWSELKGFLATAEGKEYLDVNNLDYNWGYSLMFKLMGILAEKFGDENVRWVVWFDN